MLASNISINIITRCKTAIFAYLIVGFFTGLSSASTLFAADEAALPSTGKPLKLPWMDEPLEPLEPINPRTPEMQNEVNAQAWYMTGRFLQGRNNFRGAFDAYRKARDLAPNSLPIYRALVPLAFSLNQTTDALRYALRAVELDPNDYLLLRQLGVHMASQRKYEEGIKLILQATQSNRVKKQSAVFIQLNRDLAILYSATKDDEHAADSYAIIFDALQNPAKYKLDFNMRSLLSADPRTSYEAIGTAFLKAKRMEAAVKAFELAAKSPRGKPGLLSYNLAQVYQATGKHKQAAVQLQKYFDAKLQEKGLPAYELLAEILKSQKQPDTLQQKIEELAQADPQNPYLQLFLGNLYLEKKDYSQAEAAYKKSSDIAESVAAYTGLISVYRHLQKPEKLLNTFASILGMRTTLEDPTLE